MNSTEIMTDIVNKKFADGQEISRDKFLKEIMGSKSIIPKTGAKRYWLIQKCLEAKNKINAENIQRRTGRRLIVIHKIGYRYITSSEVEDITTEVRITKEVNTVLKSIQEQNHILEARDVSEKDKTKAQTQLNYLSTKLLPRVLRQQKSLTGS